MMQNIDEAEMAAFGQKIGSQLSGGEVIELVGDVGAGKTTLTRSIARGMGINEVIQSPTFTISNRYETGNDLTLNHYDFYRLEDAGIMNHELAESVNDKNAVVVVEWANIVRGVLPEDHLTIVIETETEDTRSIVLTAHGDKSAKLVEAIS